MAVRWPRFSLRWRIALAASYRNVRLAEPRHGNSATSQPHVSSLSTPVSASFSHQISGTVSASSHKDRRYVEAVRFSASSIEENVVGLRTIRVWSVIQPYGR